MSKYTLNQVFRECQKLKFEANLSYRLTDIEIHMIELAYLNGHQRQLEKNITDLEKETT